MSDGTTDSIQLGLGVIGQAADKVIDLQFQLSEQKRETARMRRALHLVKVAESLEDARQIANNTLGTEGKSRR